MRNPLIHFLIATPLYLSVHLTAGDFQVVSGSATATSQGNQTIIENSPQAILHWDHFSIPQGDHLHFAQMNAASKVLNRVTGNQFSALLGTLTSNGQVYLINPQGILVGPNAFIQTAGFIASTADISNADFINGKDLLFKLPGSGKIVNQGMIQCAEGNIFLIAKEISNEGICEGKFIGMGSGTEVLIQPEGDQRVYIRLESLDSGEISNTGTLQALAVELQSTSPYDKAIRMGGKTETLSLHQQGGKILLSATYGGVSIDGTLAAPSGEIQVLGKEIVLEATSLIDTSGPSGGKISIGGGSRGQDPSLFNADNVYVAQGAAINADGLSSDAGSVIIWGNEVTDFNGHINARALGTTGNGGFAEISALAGIRVNDHPDLRAAHGIDGHLLIDPGSVTVQSGPNTAPPVSMDLFNDGWINGQLALSSLTIDTANSTNGGTQNLSVNNNVAISWSTDNTLSLIAGANFTLFTGTATITNTAAGSINIYGNSNGTVIGTSTFSFVNGNISFFGRNTPTGGTGITCFGPTVTASGTGNISLQGIGQGGIAFGNGTIVTSNQGNITLLGENIASAAGFNGVQPNVSTLSSSGTGNISLIGTSGTGVSSHAGVDLFQTTISVTNGNLSIRGNTQIGDNGVLANSPTITSTGTGNISISGTTLAPATIPTALGTFLTAGTNINSTGTGSIAIVGTSPGNTGLMSQGAVAFPVMVHAINGNIALAGSGSLGISLINSTQIFTTGSGSIAAETLSQSDFNIQEASFISTQGTGALAVASSRDLLILGGSNPNASALISNNSGTALISAARDLILTGGSASGAAAAIRPIGTSASICVSPVGRNLTLTAGTAADAQAQIGSILTTAQGNITVGSVIGATLLDGFNTTSFAAIGHGSPGNAVSNLSGQIILLTGGDITLRGATAGAGTFGFAQIGHVDQTGQSSTLSGNFNISSQGSINVLGGSLATASAQIGHGGQSLTTTIGACQMTIKAGINCTILSSTGQANIVNRSSVPNSGNLTLVVDNLFNTQPHAGTGSFTFGSTLTATGKLKIYTSTQAFNHIAPGTLINGAPFFPGPLYKNSATEEWGIWFPGGSYGATPFKFYYKDDFFGIPAELVIANMGSLADLLPVIPTREFNIQFLNACSVWKKKLFYCDVKHAPILSSNWTDQVNLLDLEFELIPEEVAQDEPANKEGQF
jgi:filamentous hemagglutinin family protein